eukprot:scaffold5141_cov169-Amphora_coffeaeformis.AAC.12
MIRTKDSVEDLRKSRKRPQPTQASSASSSCMTPLDELKHMAKKRRANASSSNSSNMHPPRVTKVKFALERNCIHSRAYDEEDLKNAWNSRAEAAFVKLGAQLTVDAFKAGTLDNKMDCLRGLEVLADSERVEVKITRSHDFITRVLEQQHFLRSVMGKANDAILAKMSKVLSAQDVREARETASHDATTALYIHACDQALRIQACGKKTDSLIAEDLERRLKGDELVTLLQQQLMGSL